MAHLQREIEWLAAGLRDLGVRPGDTLLVHASFKATGAADPESVIRALLEALGPGGTLLMPALSYLQHPIHVHDTRHTPSCVGFLTEHFRTRPGTRRSLHPTHSVCAVGPRTAELLDSHFRDTTPCGPCSPFRLLTERGGRILMLGCGLRPMTTMHAVEEIAEAPYVFGGEREFVITDSEGRTFRRTHRIHGFHGWEQRYDRLAGLLSAPDLVEGVVGRARCHLLDAAALRRAALEAMAADPYAFVERARGR